MVWASYSKLTAHHIVQHMVHFATIHVHSGLLTINTILHGSYSMAEEVEAARNRFDYSSC